MRFHPAWIVGSQGIVLVRQRHSDPSTMALTVTCGKMHIPPTLVVTP